MSLFWNALRQQRLALVIWAVALAFTCLSVVSAGTAVTGNALGDVIAGYPPALRELMGGDLILQRPLDGYINAKLLLFLPLLIGLFAAFQAAGTVARELEQRRMDFLLSLPVTRARVLWTRLLALWTGVGILWAVAAVVLALAMGAYGLAGDWTGYLMSMWTGLLLNVALATLALWASAATGDYRRALRAGMGLVVLLYMLDTGLRMVQAPTLWRRLVLYGLYDPTQIVLTHRYPWVATLAFVLVTAAAATLAVRSFQAREV